MRAAALRRIVARRRALPAPAAAPAPSAQQDARERPCRTRSAPSDYDVEHPLHGQSGAWFVERETDEFICAAKRRDGDCDWFQATLKNAGWEVVLDEREAGCVLPF